MCGDREVRQPRGVTSIPETGVERLLCDRAAGSRVRIKLDTVAGPHAWAVMALDSDRLAGKRARSPLSLSGMWDPGWLPGTSPNISSSPDPGSLGNPRRPHQWEAWGLCDNGGGRLSLYLGLCHLASTRGSPHDQNTTSSVFPPRHASCFYCLLVR